MDPADISALRTIADRALIWLEHSVWPLWLTQGVDTERRAFHENLSLGEFACTAEFRRLRVAARQIYVASEAMLAGNSAALEAIEVGLDFLRRHAWQPSGGYASQFDLTGMPINLRRDLYDHAFVLMALASAARVPPFRELRAQISELDAYIQTTMRHPLGGYLEGLPPSLPRRQNPHMHLLEAYLAAADTLGEPKYLDRAEELVRLFVDHLFQAAEGTLPEYFGEDFQVWGEGGRFVVEPGHHAEWVWLLHWYKTLARRAGRQPAAGIDQVSSQLLAFIDRCARNEATGGLIDEVWNDGTPKSSGSRLWPQTELLKAEVLRPDATAERIEHAYKVLFSYIAPAPEGLWCEPCSSDGIFSREPAPASSLYHITAAIVTCHKQISSW